MHKHLRISCLLLAGWWLLAACGHREEISTASSPGKSSTAPWFTRGEGGETILYWAETDTTSGMTIQVFAKWDAQSKHLAEHTATRPVPGLGTHPEGMPKMIFQNDVITDIYAQDKISPSNRYASELYLTVSRDKGLSWTAPVPVSGDTIPDVDHSFCDAEVLHDGTIALVRMGDVNGRRPLIFNRIKNGKVISEMTLDDEICECCRLDIMQEPGGRIHVLYRDILPESIRDIVHIQSDDSGASFSAPLQVAKENWVISGCPDVGPSMVKTRNEMVITYFTGAGNPGIRLCSTRPGEPAMPESLSHHGRHAQLAEKNGTIAIVWDEQVPNSNESRIRFQLRKETAVIHDEIVARSLDGVRYPVIASEGDSWLIAWVEGPRRFSSVRLKVLDEMM